MINISEVPVPTPVASVDVHKVISKEAAATFVGLSDPTFKRVRLSGEGPRHVQLSKNRIGFRYIDLIQWIEARVSEKGAA